MHAPKNMLDLKGSNRLPSWLASLWFSLASLGLLSSTLTHAAEIANVPDSMKGRLSTSTAGLTEEFGVTGTLVRLQGRFQSLSVAEASDSGQVKVNCLAPGPESVKALERIEKTHTDKPE
jgi:hypothetical protein